ncbi:hypothetical protein [Metabacillus litoralis]|uniref:hypothetical protein n=1 Tax=Metabacillus litoralis TaxID=152268 RepID=UPI00203BD4AC|nr:hypothetical protein [Metabacillus litoralis]
MHIPDEILNEILHLVGILPRKVRGMTINKELVGATVAILNSAPKQTLFQYCSNQSVEQTKDGLDKRLKLYFNNDLRRVNIISDVLEEAGITQVFTLENPETRRVAKATRLKANGFGKKRRSLVKHGFGRFTKKWI